MKPYGQIKTEITQTNALNVNESSREIGQINWFIRQWPWPPVCTGCPPPPKQKYFGAGLSPPLPHHGEKTIKLVSLTGVKI